MQLSARTAVGRATTAYHAAVTAARLSPTAGAARFKAPRGSAAASRRFGPPRHLRSASSTFGGCSSCDATAPSNTWGPPTPHWSLRPAESSLVAAATTAAASPRIASRPSGGGYWAECTACGLLAVQAVPRCRRARRTLNSRPRTVVITSAVTGVVGGGDGVSGIIEDQARETVEAVEEAEPLQWPAERVRQAYIDFFVQRKQHTFVPASPVVPLNDPTLLFVNAGMNQFKAIFMGQLEQSSPLQGMRRAVNSQKCIRAGGKHNDLDDVGRDVYHHTFFEMLGNWSFGDYFKEEAIDWAWELLTKVYGLQPERLYASYFGGDEAMGLPADLEAKSMWERHLPASRILAFGKGDNFWEMGAVGPCGPCSELHYDRIGGRDAAELVNADDPDVIEIWNLVFMQFYRNDDGSLVMLPSRHIDTGMGLERVVSVLQDRRSNYDTDVFAPLLEAVHDLVGGEPYRGYIGDADTGLRDTAYRIIVDHARTLTLSVADGAVPSSEGRGYVLRRILRRAVRFGRQMLYAPPGFFSKLVPVVVGSLGTAFPELNAAQERVQAILHEEEVAFDRTVERGMQFFSELKADLRASGATVVPGERAFLLYDSHGFPLDLTQQMAEESGLTVDSEGFESAMEVQKERSRVAMREQQASERGMRPMELVAEHTAWLGAHGVAPTDDAQKYEWDVVPVCSVLAIYTEAGFVDSTAELTDEVAMVGVVLNKTPFYAEAGGQASDVGQFVATAGDNCATSAPVLQVKAVRAFGGFLLHQGLLVRKAGCSSSTPQCLSVGDEVRCEVDYDHRRRVARNHTMTHALNWSLREVLGEGVDQRGSLVSAERLRFDFSAETVSTSQLTRVEGLVQGLIANSLRVTVCEAPLQQALAVTGVRAVSGEAYPDPVRVVSIGAATVGEVLETPSEARWRAQSVEFCGGTHIADTAEARAFVIFEEKAIARGVRRIVAATGEAAQCAHEEGERVVKLLSELETSKSVDEGAIQDLSKYIAVASISATLKPACRERLDTLRKRLRKKQKGAAKAHIVEAQATLAASVASAVERGVQHCVVCVEDLDAKALQQTLQGTSAEIALLVIARHGSSVNCLATLPEACQAAGHAADAWVRASLEPLGGRGGGKPGRAQGSAKLSVDGGEATRLATEAAEAYWS